VAETSQLPRPAALHPAGALSSALGDEGGDLVDWSIALLVLLIVLAGSLCLVQKVLGRKLQFSRPLHRFQRWFFDPTHYSLGEDENDATAWDASDKLDRSGEGHMYTFGEDVIPLSMGGRIGWGPGFILGSVAGSHDDSDGSGPDELEMVSSRPKKLSDEFLPEDEDGDAGLLSRSLTASPSPLFLRNPDFVALPDLTRSSKVAVPIGLHSTSHHSQDSLDD
jgi:hypothetical protein